MEESKYKPNSPESNMVSIIYDTLMGNKQYPQFKNKNVSSYQVNDKNGEITFKYKLDEIFGEKGIEKLSKPMILNVKLNLEIK